MFITSKQYLVNRPPYNRVFLIKSHGPVRPLACPARFERATYALEAGKMRLNNSRNNDISLTRSGVRYAPRTMVRGGIAWILGGIGRQFNGWREICRVNRQNMISGQWEELTSLER